MIVSLFHAFIYCKAFIRYHLLLKKSRSKTGAFGKAGVIAFCVNDKKAMTATSSPLPPERKGTNNPVLRRRGIEGAAF
jgi:hypothetical protein